MSEKLNIDNIESFFKKSLENYEEEPSKDLWANIAKEIPTYNASGAAAIQVSVAKTSSMVSIKAAIITSSVIASVVVGYIIYDSLANKTVNNQVNTPTQLHITADSVSNLEVSKDKAATSSEKLYVSKNNSITEQETKSTNDSPTQNAPSADVIGIDTMAAKPFAVAKDTVATPATEPEKKPATLPKKESFYQRNAAKLKDSSKNVFTPE